MPHYTKGPEDSSFLIIGEAPGTQEMKQKLPFVGPSGMILDEALKQYQEYPDPFYTNVIPHMVQGDAKDSKQEKVHSLVEQYRKSVLEEVGKHPRRVILALGNAALWALTGDHSLKITKVRGQLFESPLAEVGIVAATHPAYLLRGNGSFRQFKMDVAYAMRLANGGKPRVFEYPTWEICKSIHHVNHFLGLVRKHEGVIAGDIETSGFSFLDDHILCQGFSFDGKHVYVIPGKKSDLSSTQNFTKNLAPMWNAPKERVQYCWQNGKFDVKFYHAIGQEGARVDEDTMLESYALDETRGIHGLETLSSDWLGSPDWKGVLDEHKKKNQSYDVIPWKVLFKYMVYDVANTFNLHNVLRPLVAADKGSERLYTRTLIPASAYLAEIEKCGMMVDKERVEQNTIKFGSIAADHRNTINDIAIASGYGPINPNSPAQLADLMYNTLKIPSKERGTDAKTLDKLPDVPVVVALRKYRKVNKGLTTYVTPAIENIASDGRVHPSYLLHGTATGRLACRDPNLQNIPRDPELRGQFIPRPGYCFIEVDLNQAELRSLAALSGDEALCNIYVDPNSKGLHEEVRKELYGMAGDWDDFLIEKYRNKWYITEADPIDRIVEEQKMRSKNVNFGIVYGITSFGLAEQIEDTPQEAGRMLSGWAKKFPRAWAFIERCRNAPLRGQNLVTCFGHKKRFQIVAPEILVGMQNEAANFPHQSTASTVTIHGGMRVQKRLKEEYDTTIVNTVHDSVILEAPLDREIIRQAAAITKAEMEQVPIDWGITRIPFQADCKAGMRWGSMDKLSKFLENSAHLLN